MKGRMSISLGENDKERREAALRDLAAAVGAVGISEKVSISELIVRIADAYDSNKTEITSLMEKIMKQSAIAQIESIVYTVETDEDVYTEYPEETVLIPALVDRIERAVSDYMAVNYPGVPFETRRVPNRSSHNDRPDYRAPIWENREPERAAEEIIRELDLYVSNDYTDWMEQIAAAI